MNLTASVSLYCGDCLEVLPMLEAHSVDAIITDLPYGTTACKWDEVIPFAPMWEQVKRVLKPRGAFVTTASQPFTSALVMSNPAWFKYEWIWRKSKPTGHLDAKRRPMKQHENIVVFSASSHVYNPQGTVTGEFKTYRQAKAIRHTIYNQERNHKEVSTIGNYPKSVLDSGGVSDVEREHPTQKPVALYEYLIRTYTNEGDTVLDFTMGSGTTGVAAINTGRNFVGVEKDSNYFAIAEKRIAEAQAQLSLEMVLA